VIRASFLLWASTGVIKNGISTTNSPLIYAAFGPLISQISGHLRSEGRKSAVKRDNRSTFNDTRRPPIFSPFLA